MPERKAVVGKVGKPCMDCGAPIGKAAQRCKSCSGKKRALDRKLANLAGMEDVPTQPTKPLELRTCECGRIIGPRAKQCKECYQRDYYQNNRERLGVSKSEYYLAHKDYWQDYYRRKKLA